MSSKCEKTQGTVIRISESPVTALNTKSIIWQAIDCTTKDVQYSGGQKNKIDITTLNSTEKETINGLPEQAEITLSGNWSAEETGQNTLRAAYDSDAVHAFSIIFPSGNGFTFLAEVSQSSWSAASDGFVSASFTLRLKGRTQAVVSERAATSPSQHRLSGK